MFRIGLLLSLWLLSQVVFAAQMTPHPIDFKKHPEIQAHMRVMGEKYGFTPSQLNHWYHQARVQPQVIQKIKAPYEKKPWYQYRHWFVQPDRIQAGVKFWHAHRKTLKKAQAKYGVPAEIIVAIIGVETFYGRYQSPYRAMDALVTLAYGYPKRAPFFQSELENLLLLAREQQVSPLSIHSSYAGAIGLPQFMPSSYRRYGVNFDDKKKIDLVNSPNDAIGSVAHYLAHFGWKAHQPIAIALHPHGNITHHFSVPTYRDLMLGKRIAQRKQLHIPTAFYQTPVGILTLQQKDHAEYWLGLNNLFVITRYNTSVRYAMAVFQLSQAIAKAYHHHA